MQRFEGFVAKFMGDGVLVYFGYPQAHEDDAERAVRAGLELVAAVGDLKTHAALQTRVGIATGQVVVGDLIGSGEAQERGIVGETPNLAARLQGIAEPNSVVIADSTRKLVGNLFELQDLGALDLKGIVGPVRAWATLRPSYVESRFEALHASGLTEVVGREEELEILMRRWSKAKAGEGQVVLLSGEAGIGKSRLTAALLERLANEPHTRIRSFCSPQHTDSALYPSIGQMERAAGLTRDDRPQTKLDKLDAVLAQSSTSAEDYLTQLHMLRREADEGQRWAEKKIEISKKYVFPLMLAQGQFYLGWALAEQGHVVEGIEQIRNGITATRATGALMGFPFFLSVLARDYLDSGELRQAAATLDEALSIATEARALYFFPEVLRTKGKLLLLQDPDHPEAAQACFQQAVTMAREQGARSFLLNSAPP